MTGVVVPFRKPESAEATTSPRRRDKSFLLVPSRIRASVAKLEKSFDEVAADTTNTKHIDFNAIYEIIAILDFSAEYSR
jgi:hypothetical protein